MAKEFYNSKFNEFNTAFYGMAESLKREYGLTAAASRIKAKGGKDVLRLDVAENLSEGAFADIVRATITMLGHTIPDSLALMIKDEKKLFLVHQGTRMSESGSREIVDTVIVNNITDSTGLRRSQSAKEELKQLTWQMQDVNKHPISITYYNMTNNIFNKVLTDEQLREEEM